MTGIGIVEAAVIAERDRIIKLLDESYLSDKGKAHLIALIKGEGENK